MEPVSAQTIHFGPVYNADVGVAPVTQSFNGPLAAGVARAASPFEDIPRTDETDEDDSDEEDYTFDTEVFHSSSPLPADPIPNTPAPTLPANPPIVAAKISAATARTVKHDLALATLTKTYSSQTPSHRWRLASSRTVETVLYESCLSMDAPTYLNSLAPSFILDVSDITMMKRLFTPLEREEIMSAVPDIPTADIRMVKSLVRFFTAKTTADVREVLAKRPFLDEGEIYDREKHFDACWADLVVRLMYVPIAPVTVLGH